MFFIVSKVFWLLLQPLSLVVIFGVLGFLFLLLRRRKTSGLFVILAALVAFTSGYTTFGTLIMTPLENRFERPSQLPDDVAAIVVLGGGFNGKVSRARDLAELSNAGDRFVEAVVLARQFPQAVVVISGGFGSLTQEGESDAVVAAKFYPRLGVPSDRLVLEGESRNTAENAAFVKDLLEADGGSVVLITSAFHMPRSVGLFRKQGIEVVPWPVDYRSTGEEGIWFDLDNASENLATTTAGVREWIGLLAYRLTGQIDDLLPGPTEEP